MKTLILLVALLSFSAVANERFMTHPGLSFSDGKVIYKSTNNTVIRVTCNSRIEFGVYHTNKVVVSSNVIVIYSQGKTRSHAVIVPVEHCKIEVVEK